MHVISASQHFSCTKPSSIKFGVLHSYKMLEDFQFHWYVKGRSVFFGGGGGDRVEPSPLLLRPVPPPVMMNDDGCRAIGGNHGKPKYSKKNCPIGLTRARTRAVAVGSRLISAWATVRSQRSVLTFLKEKTTSQRETSKGQLSLFELYHFGLLKQ
jgi:hypothetical protein